MAGNKSDEINFQQYVDGVKERKLSWQFFIAVMQDLSYSDIKRLRIVNAILMTELTMNYSDMDKQKYLNEILLIQFKNHIQREYYDFEMSENNQFENSQNSNVDQISNEETFEETIKETMANEDNQLPIGHENNYLNFLRKEEIIEHNPTEINPQHADFEITENDHLQHLDALNEDMFEETTKEISTNEEIKMENNL